MARAGFEARLWATLAAQTLIEMLWTSESASATVTSSALQHPSASSMAFPQRSV
jgi:hypothetical protein